MSFVLFAVQGQGIIQDKELKLYQGGQPSDTLITSTTKDYSVYIFSDNLFTYRVTVEVDSTSGTPQFSSVLQGSMNNATWSNIDTIVYTSGVDTTFYFNETLGNTWDYLRINNVATSTAQKSKIKV